MRRFLVPLAASAAILALGLFAPFSPLQVPARAQNNISGVAVVPWQSSPAGVACTSSSPLIAYASQLYSCQSAVYAQQTPWLTGNPFTATFGAATGSSNLWTIQDSANNTGTGYVFTAGTASGSTANPFQVLVAGSPVLRVFADTHVETLGTSLVADGFLLVNGPYIATGVATARGGINDDTHSTLSISGGTSGLTTFSGPVRITATTFSGLPTCNSGAEGTQRPVTDSSTATWGATVTGSSTNHVLAYCDGTNWTVAAK